MSLTADEAWEILETARNDFNQLQREGMQESPQRARIRLCEIANRIFQGGAVDRAIDSLREECL